MLIIDGHFNVDRDGDERAGNHTSRTKKRGSQVLRAKKVRQYTRKSGQVSKLEVVLVRYIRDCDNMTRQDMCGESGYEDTAEYFSR